MIREESPYEEEPYPSFVHALTHPAEHAAMAAVLGFPLRDVEHGRVLEVGCGDGMNLIPMAESLPGAQFLGIDYTARHIQEARKRIEALGLKNIRFEHMDLRNFPQSEGEFDSIIAHGLYSWVPPGVRDAFLALCARHLAPNGVAYISYMVYPGRHAANAVRDAMRYRSRNAPGARQRVAAARQMLAFLTTFEPDPEDVLATFRRQYAAHMNETEDEVLLHDDLAKTNEAVYFWEFAEHLGRHGLAYLAETPLASVVPERYGAEAAEVLYAMADDFIEVEQYVDFLTNRSFRRSLVCRDADVAQRSLEPNPERFRQLYISSRNKPVDEPERGLPHQFRNAEGYIFPVSDPLSAAALLCLGEAFPSAFSFDELLAAARARLISEGAIPGELAADAAMLADTLLLAFSLSEGLITLWSVRPAVAPRHPERPYALRFARYCAEHGLRVVTGLWHIPVELDPIAFGLLPLLDGTNSRESLLASLQQMRPNESEPTLRADLETAIETLQQMGILSEPR